MFKLEEQMDDTAIVSVIVLNWNGGDYVFHCIEHVLQQSYRNLELIVVDNGSTDGSIEIIQHKHPGANICRNGTNKGFAYGMNQGIAIAHGKYILPLGQDVFLDKEYIARVIAAMSQKERVGVGGGRILAFDNGVKTDEQFIGGLFLGPTLSVVGGRRHREEECYVFRPSGCCPIMKREMLEEVFLATGEHYDSTYFAYGEDTDLCLRAQLMAWRALYVPEAIAWHVGSSGRPIRLANKPLWLRKLALRNRYLTVIKDFPTSFLLILLPFLIIFQLLIWLRLFLSHPINGGRLFVEVWADVIRLVPVYLEKRQSVQLRRKASLPDLLWLVRFF